MVEFSESYPSQYDGKAAVEINASFVFRLPGEVIQTLSNAIQYSCSDKCNTVYAMQIHCR